MTRRIAITFMVLITALLVLAVVPLGVSMTSNENQSFRFDARSAALQVSSAAEEYLVDHHPPTAMRAALVAAANLGDCAAVYRADGSLVDATRCDIAADQHAGALLDRAFDGHSAITGRDDRWLRVAVPIGGDEGGIAGGVVYARSADPLDDRIAAMWLWLALIGIVGLALGVGVAIWLARWVSRPLTVLGGAAAGLGDGDLGVRARVDSGPREVRRLAETFNLMADRTERLVHGQRGWVADVSHQLRTPLTALRLRLDVLGEGAGEQVAADVAGAQEEIARLSRLVDGLLAVARAESAVPKSEPVRVDEVAAERIAAWEPVARERRVALSLPRPVATTAYLGAGDLEQMLDNVIANAIDAAREDGRVWVEILEPPGKVVLRVVDDGPGMDEPAKKAAFHRFANPGARGNGLGLAIVHRLVTGSGGAVFLIDTPGGGLTVELELPAAQRSRNGEPRKQR